MVFGQDKHAYYFVNGWGKHFYTPFIEATGLGIDRNDRIYVLSRGLDPVMIFDSEGNFLKCWGREYASWPHGICVSSDNFVFTADGDHTVKKLTQDGKLMMTLGKRNQPSDTGCKNKDYRTIKQEAGPFNYPTDVALDDDGNIYVSDGYGNSRIHKFSKDGELLISWGKLGNLPGQFCLPHGIFVFEDIVFVADRENSRIQLFNTEGKFIDQWYANRPTDIFVHDKEVFVSELGYNTGLALKSTEPRDGIKTARISIFTLEGELLSRWGTDEICKPGSFMAPHCICVDSMDSIYVGEVTITSSISGNVPVNCHTVQKFVKAI